MILLYAGFEHKGYGVGRWDISNISKYFPGGNGKY